MESTHYGRTFRGLCTGYFARLGAGYAVPLWIRPGNYGCCDAGDHLYRHEWSALDSPEAFAARSREGPSGSPKMYVQRLLEEDEEVQDRFVAHVLGGDWA